MVTLKEVAELAEVSRSAVSRTFTEGASVSKKTREKVLRAAEKLGYSPNLLARSLTTRSTKLIGLASNNFENPIFLEIFDIFTRRIQEKGYRSLIVNVTAEHSPAKLLKMMLEYSVDGVIMASSNFPPSFTELFLKQGVPIVHAFGRASDNPKVNTVSVDNHLGGFLAAEHLIALGYRSIGFLGGPKTASTTIDRWAGFCKAAERHPGVMISSVNAESYSFQAGRNAMQALLQGPMAEAYFCGDDVLSMGAISALRDAGLAVPADVGIIGFNDMKIASWPGVDLTTIRQPLQQIIYSSVDLVIASLEQPGQPPEVRLFPCEIIERGTLPKRATPDTIPTIEP